MDWQTKPPAQEGEYWAYEDLDPVDADVMRVSYDVRNGVFWVGCKSFLPEHFSHFMPYTEVQPTPPDHIGVVWYRVVYQVKYESGTIVESSFEIKSKDTGMSRVGAMAQNIAQDKAGANVEIIEIKKLGSEFIKTP